MAYRLMLKHIRELQGIRQEDMARMLEMKLSTYRSWEQGVTRFTLENAYRCAKLLNCTPNDLCNFPTTSQTFSDPRQAELNRCWNATDETRQATVLQVARDAAGASGSGRKSDSSQEASPPGVISA